MTHQWLHYDDGTAVCEECGIDRDAYIEALERELAETQKAWSSEAEAHAKAMEIIYEMEEEELKLQEAYEAKFAEMVANS